jgi:hypothetical protein
VQVDRFWVTRFGERNNNKLALQEAVLIEKERHKVLGDDLKRYFEAVDSHLKKVPSLFVCNADETRIGPPKKQHTLLVIVSKDTRLGTTTVLEARDDAQSTLLAATSALGDSIPPRIISKTKMSRNLS